VSAVILAFPARSPIAALAHPGPAASPFSAAWLATHVPLVEVGLELISCSDDDLSRRCAAMADEDGRMLVGELAGRLQRLGQHLADVGDALSLAAERIRDAMVPTI
jgi:hypothetical protein